MQAPFKRIKIGSLFFPLIHSYSSKSYNGTTVVVSVVNLAQVQHTLPSQLQSDREKNEQKHCFFFIQPILWLPQEQKKNEMKQANHYQILYHYIQKRKPAKNEVFDMQLEWSTMMLKYDFFFDMYHSKCITKSSYMRNFSSSAQ